RMPRTRSWGRSLGSRCATGCWQALPCARHSDGPAGRYSWVRTALQICDTCTKTPVATGPRLVRSNSPIPATPAPPVQGEPHTMRSRFLRTAVLAATMAALAALLLPAAASAQGVAETLEAKALELDMVWVAIACVLVFLMQAGFMF